MPPKLYSCKQCGEEFPIEQLEKHLKENHF